MSLIADKFLKHLEENKDKKFFYTIDQELNGHQCLSLIREIELFLKKNSIQTIAISAKNSIFWPIFYVAAKLAAKDIYIFDPNLPSTSANLAIEKYSIDCICLDLNLDNGFDESTVKIHRPHIGKRYLSGQSHDILFTSGTTAEPKGVVISEQSYIHVASTLANTLNQLPSDFELLSMPFYHSFGLTRLRVSLLTGNSSFISDGLKKFPEIYSFSKSHPFTGLSFVPSAIEIIKGLLRSKVKDFASSIRYLEIGSSSLSDDSRKWLREYFMDTNVIHHYGMTECSRAFIRDRGAKDNFDIDDSWLGNPLNGCDFKIADTLKEGELLLRGKNLFSGYLQTKLNAEKMQDGWLKTGDVCKVKNGKVFLRGRIDNQINIGGEKIQAETIESIIESLISVKGCICFAEDDSILGSKLSALISIPEDGDKKNVKELKIIFNQVFAEYPSFYKPNSIILVDEIPLTHNGKKIRNTQILLGFQQ
jgi:long-chain acyl-CoA synthetase